MLLGVGARHYTESNLFASFSIGYVQANPAMEAEIDFSDSNHGFGIEIEIGKEWWLGSEWGLGGAFAFTYVRNHKKGFNAAAYGINFLLSITYN